jgi:hypothetical protein
MSVAAGTLSLIKYDDAILQVDLESGRATTLRGPSITWRGNQQWLGAFPGGDKLFTFVETDPTTLAEYVDLFDIPTRTATHQFSFGAIWVALIDDKYLYYSKDAKLWQMPFGSSARSVGTLNTLRAAAASNGTVYATDGGEMFAYQEPDGPLRSVATFHVGASVIAMTANSSRLLGLVETGQIRQWQLPGLAELPALATPADSASSVSALMAQPGFVLVGTTVQTGPTTEQGALYKVPLAL